MHSKFAPLALVSLLLAACGGGGGGGGGDSAPATPAPAPNTSTVSVVIPSSSYAAGSVELGGWTTLQQARVLCGFGALRQNQQLDAAALAHTRYLVNISVVGTSSVLSHYETSSTNPYYTGYYPWDRSLAQGYGDQVAEILEASVWDYDVTNPPVFPSLEQRGAASMLSLLNTVYHLIGAMYDGADVGFGAALQTVASGSSRREEYRFGSLNGYQTQRIRLGRGNLATYPCEGSNNVPTTFIPANESPNPFPAMTSTSQTVGPPIYLKVDAGQVLKVNSASVGSGSISVPVTVLTQANDPQAELGANEVFVVPNTALIANARYQVNLAGSINGVPFSRSFSMSTGP